MILFVTALMNTTTLLVFLINKIIDIEVAPFETLKSR